MATYSCSCLGNPMDRGAWWATVHRVTRVGHDLATIPSPPHPVFLVALAGRLLPILQTCLEPRDCGTQAGSALPPTYL